MVALDTNVAVAINNGRPREVAWVKTLTVVCLPTPVLGELLYGAANSARAAANRQQVLRLRALCQLLPVDEVVAEQYAIVRLALKARGRPIPENDVWIAAVCLGHGVPLATADAHFSAVDGLQLITP